MAKKKARKAESPKPQSPPPSSAYDRHKEKMAEKSRERSAAGRDIGPIPPVANPARRARAAKSLRNFLETYFPERFPLKWSPDHLKVIARIEEAVLSGGRFAVAMPRGSGKTTMAECAILWAVLFGYHPYAVLIGAAASHATSMLESIKAELVDNPHLAEDFPEVCLPAAAIGGNPLRCNGQTAEGVRTRIQWKKAKVVFPAVAGSKSAEAVLQVVGITGSLRGMKFTRQDGRIVRPSLVLVDDPQTDASAYSEPQCRRRLQLMNGAILKLAGPGKKIAAVCTVTVVRRGDMADKLLNREESPQWKGERCKMLYKFPQNMEKWQQYAILLADSQRKGGNGEPARDWYREEREAMDLGAQVAWPERKDEDDLSALESAMRLFFEDRESFMAECQNEPLDQVAGEHNLKPAELRRRYVGRARGLVPAWADKVTAFIDVQQKALYWLVAAWDAASFTGAVIDYGTWPDQRGRGYFRLADLQYTIQDALPAAGLEGQIRHALDECSKGLLDREWLREDLKLALRVDRLFVDNGFMTDTVYEFARASPHASIITPTKGKPISAKQTPMSEYKAKDGEKGGFHWFMSFIGKRAIRYVQIDVNFWKTFMVQRLRQAIGDHGAWSFFGSREDGTDHEMLADHLCAEFSKRVSTDERVVFEWLKKPGDPDNHWLDGLVGAAAAASFEGVHLPGSEHSTKKRKVSWREQQARKINGR